MLKRYKDYIKESLLDNLTGPTEQDVWNHIQTLDGWEKKMYGCIKFGNTNLLQTVINQNPDYLFNKIGFSFVIEAMKHNDNETKYNVIKMLLDNGANMNSVQLNLLSNVMNQFNLDDRTRRLIIDDTNKKMHLKESLLDKLQGPSKEEMWKNFGYDEIIDTPEEYFINVFNNLKFSEEEVYHNKGVYCKKWKDSKGFLVIEYHQLTKFVVRCWLGEFTDIMESVFDLTYKDCKKVIIPILRKELNLKDDVDIVFIYDNINYEDDDYDEDDEYDEYNED